MVCNAALRRIRIGVCIEAGGTTAGMLMDNDIVVREGEDTDELYTEQREEEEEEEEEDK
jgi:hypothetical protein